MPDEVAVGVDLPPTSPVSRSVEPPVVRGVLSEQQGVELLARLRSGETVLKETTPSQAKAQPALAEPARAPDTTDDNTEADSTENSEDAATVDGDDQEDAQKTQAETLPAADSIVFKLDDGTPVTAQEAQKGYLRQADYTRSKQEFAKEHTERRQLVDSRAAIVDQAAQWYAERMDLVEAQLKAAVPPLPDPGLRLTDSNLYWDRYHEHERQLKAYQSFVVGNEQIKAQREQSAALRDAEIMKAEATALFDALPEWRNPETMTREQKALTAYARGRGFSDDEMAMVDHRLVLVLRDAEFGAAQRAAKSKAAAKPKVVDPTLTARNGGGVAPHRASDGKFTASNGQRSASQKIDPNLSRRDQEAAAAERITAMLQAKRRSDARR